MRDLFRIVIAEMPRFPELARARFSQGKLPYFESVRRYRAAEHDAGTARAEDPELAATQVLGTISNALSWPGLLLPDRDVDDARVDAVARYAIRG